MRKPLFSKASYEGYLTSGNYTEEEMTIIQSDARRIYDELTKGKVPQGKGKTNITMIVGPYGSGKSTLYKTLGLETQNSILVDNDDIRKKMSTYQNSINKGMKEGLTYEQADKEAWDKWLDASVYTHKWLMNHLHQEGFNIIRMGAINNKTTQEIIENTKAAGSELNTVILYAPLTICRKSIEKRVSEGGHPTNENSFINEFKRLDRLSDILAHSDHVKLYWRPELHKSPRLVGEGNTGKNFLTHDYEGISHMANEMDCDKQDAYGGEIYNLDILSKAIKGLEEKKIQKRIR